MTNKIDVTGKIDQATIDEFNKAWEKECKQASAKPFPTATENRPLGLENIEIIITCPYCDSRSLLKKQEKTLQCPGCDRFWFPTQGMALLLRQAQFPEYWEKLVAGDVMEIIKRVKNDEM